MFRLLLATSVAISLLPVPAAEGGGWRWLCRRPIPRTRCCCCCIVYRSAAPASAEYSKYPVKSFVDPQGVQRYAIRTNEVDDYEQRPSLDAQRFSSPLLERQNDAQGDSDTYPSGGDREAAKTSIADGRADYYDNIRELIGNLPADEVMRTRSPRIRRAPDSGRVNEEDRNVTVDAYLYAASREEDNDFHLIIGSGGRRSSRTYFNVEISGLPSDRTSEDYDDLERVRDFYKSYFGENLPGRGYDVYERTPFRVRVTGSLFYDISHGAGAVGPTGYKPDTAWEIHPVTRIEFLDD